MVNEYLDDQILKHVGGKYANNLNEILGNYDDTEFEIRTFGESHYVAIDSLPSVLLPIPNKFSLLSINIQSINPKFDKLATLLTMLKENNFIFSTICIQETWLTQNHDTSILNLPGYNLIHQGKICSEHGGLITYLKEDFTYSIRNV